MITGFDLVLFCLIGLALILSQQPKRIAIGACIGALAAIWIFNLTLSGEYLYWAIAAAEISTGYLLWFLTYRLTTFEDRVYYRAMAGFLWGSCIITGLYLYDVGAYADHRVYVSASHGIAITHTFFMLVFADGFSSWVVRNLRRLGGVRTTNHYH